MKKPLLNEEIDKIRKMMGLNELEIGKVLFGEPKGKYWITTDDSVLSGWRELGIPHEPNTVDEKELIQLLRDWIVKEKGNPELGKFLKELLPLKKKFPTVLNPTEGRDVYDGTSFYRGTLIPLRDVLNLGGWFIDRSVNFSYGAIGTNDPYLWNSTSQKGFTSLTPVIETANKFATDYMDKNGMQFTDIVNRLSDGSGMIPVIISVDDTHKDIIMNPKFMNIIGGLREYEVLLVGNVTKTDSVIIPNWELIEKAASELGVDLTNYFNIN